MNSELKRLPKGLQTFPELRTEGYLYVDKTDLIYQMAYENKYVFLSRPRRFGKSLLMSTLQAYFEGRRELFEGLKIMALEQEWKTYPVFHLDLNQSKYETPESLVAELNGFVTSLEEKYGRQPWETELAMRFSGVVQRAAEQEGHRVVILIDEYDKPMLNAIGNEPLQEAFRRELKAFYSVLKSQDRYIKFAFLTGVTKFGKISVFSDLNHLFDISMSEQYSTLCGFTEQEIHDNFGDRVALLAAKNGITEEEAYRRLRESYDGYRFNRFMTDGVYNPFSLLCTFQNLTFGEYWFETGTPTYLVTLLQQYNYKLDELTEEEVTADVLNSVDPTSRNPIPVIYQSGYLTICGYDDEFELYRLGFPNKEVEHGFTRFLIPYYTPMSENNGPRTIGQMVRDIRSGNAESFMQRLLAIFADTDYRIVGKRELYFHNALAVIFKMLSFNVETERPANSGRMDMVVKTDAYIYVFEFKVDKSADAALAQIKEKGYHLPFVTDPRPVVLIGVNFSSETRGIEEWKVEATEDAPVSDSEERRTDNNETKK